MSMLKRRMILSLGAVAVVGAGMLAWRADIEPAVAATNYQQLQKFAQVMELVRRSYVEEVSDEKLIDGALNGMLTSLDPHSNYMTKEVFGEMQVETKGEFGGLGIEISSAEGGVRVVAPIEDTPAWKVGIKAGDLIIKIDDALARNMEIGEAVKRMRGKPGTKVVLTIFREGEKGPLTFTIERDVIQVKSVKSDLLAPGMLYLRVTQFQEHTGEMLKEQIAALKAKSKEPIRGAVLDLRNNPGGLLNQAVEVSDIFLDSGGIVSTKSRAGSDLSYSAEKGDLLDGVPMVVLINGGSASAAEIVGGALQDNHRAVLMGSRSFGKGSVQSVFPLADGTAMKLTTALYYTPSGRSIQATGIKPEIEVEQTKVGSESEEKGNDGFGISERDLKGHLQNGNGEAAGESKGSEKSADTLSPEMKKRLAGDNVLQRAADLLKGLQALSARS